MERNLYVFRIITAYILLLLIFVGLTIHLYSIQIMRHGELYAKAVSTYTARKTFSGVRGSIFDRNGNPLTGNLECKNILADLFLMPKGHIVRQEIIDDLAAILDVDPHKLSYRFRSGSREVVVKNRVDLEIARKVERLKIQGIRLVDDQKRYYPKGALLANVLGFTNSENNGVYGIESVWNRELAPKKIEEVYERSRKGTTIGSITPVITKKVDGNAIYLTIDEPIQHFVESELDEMVKRFAPKAAYAVMANPKTGAIMALSQYPSFNPNNRGTMKPISWRNHVIADVYDPGSTMKCIAIAGALDYGTVSMDTVIDCEKGYWIYARRPLRDSGHSYEDLTVAEIIQKSSNIGTAKIALKMGKQRLYQTLRRFGFGNRTNIGLPHESPGIFRKPRTWDGLSITRFPIGQGISVTGLQMVQAYCGLANEGAMMQLYLIDRITNPQTGDITYTPPKLKCHVVRPTTARMITAAMIQVTEDGGTATKAAIDGYDVAGKTGTSQKLVNGSYSGHGKYISSFIGFVPALNPAFVLLVIADEPSKGSYYGGTVAAPTFRRIADRTLRYLNIEPNELATIDQKVSALP